MQQKLWGYISEGLSFDADLRAVFRVVLTELLCIFYVYIDNYHGSLLVFFFHTYILTIFYKVI